MYVIKSTFTWFNKKLNKEFTDVSYFRAHNSRVFSFNSMVGNPDEAKQYETKAEAAKDRKAYFGNAKNTSIEPVK